ncbi:MAG TPA: hypothetical protein VGI78_23085, partial [Acetobacteraceae bacterium]
SFTSYWLQYPNRFRFIWFNNYLSLLDDPLFLRSLGHCQLNRIRNGFAQLLFIRTLSNARLYGNRLS